MERDFDSNYFQEIKPEMAVLTGTGASGGINANVQDHTMWAEMANLAAFAGADGNFGTHDATEDPYKATTVSAWNNGTTYATNDIVSGSDNNYYRFKTWSIYQHLLHRYSKPTKEIHCQHIVYFYRQTALIAQVKRRLSIILN